MKHYGDMSRLLKELAAWLRDEKKLQSERIQVCLPLSLFASEISSDIDGQDLELVLHQLVDNSLKYSEPDTAILLGFERREGKVHISVTDQGKGIDQADMAHIFERRYRGKHPGIGGSGLGLPVCKRIIEQEMDGKMWAESEPGKGSQFSIELPTSEKPARARSS
jgi:signal transduction histidine kinase